MAKYNLQPNEVVVLTESNVAHGGLMARYTDELMLTNLNLVLIKKGVLGNGKGVLTFPLSQIKVWEGRAQAIAGKARNGTPVLDVFFVEGPKVLFQVGLAILRINGEQLLDATDGKAEGEMRFHRLRMGCDRRSVQGGPCRIG